MMRNAYLRRSTTASWLDKSTPDGVPLEAFADFVVRIIGTNLSARYAAQPCRPPSLAIKAVAIR